MSLHHKLTKNDSRSATTVGNQNKDMFHSRSLVSRKGPLRSIWVAAYCSKKLKRAHVTSTDISSSVDKILQDEFNAVTYRVLAYLLLGIVRIYSKKVEYLFDDCNKSLLNIKDFVIRHKGGILTETLHTPYFSITLPERFELDAFDLEILEDTSCGNVMSREEITVKDSMWNSGSIEKYSLNQGTCFGGYTPIEDVLSCHQMDFEIEEGTSTHGSNLQASTGKLGGNRASQHECVEIEMFSAVEDGPPDPANPNGENHGTIGENTNVPLMVDSDERHEETNMHKLQDKNVCTEPCVNLETFGRDEEETINLVKPHGEHHQSDRNQIKVPHMAQSENERRDAIQDPDLSDVEAVIEKLLDNRVSQEECMDIQVACAVQEPPANARLVNEDCQTDEDMALPRNNQNQVSKDNGLSIKLDVTPQTKFHDNLATEPEFLVISTPATKEHARSLRKRKCLFDDVIVFPNNIIKQQIEDSSDLVSKRQKAPRTALAAWKAHRVSSPSRCFLEPLIPWVSLDLRPIFSKTSLTIPELVETVEPSQKLESECPFVGVSVETAVTSEKLVMPLADSVGRPVETVKPLDKLFASKSPSVARLVETLGPTEKVGMSIGKSIEITEIPQKFVSECSSVDRLVEAMERQEKLVMQESNVDTPEKLRVSESPTISRLFESVVVPEELGIPESPPAGGSLEQTAIAPETPIQHTSMLRSFESPEGHEATNMDRPRLVFRNADPEPCSYKDLDLDLYMLNEEINSCEEDSEDHYGLSDRTRVAARYLNRSFLSCKGQAINLFHILEGRTAKESARLFYEILVLKSKRYVCVKQESAYGDVLIWKTSQWDQALVPTVNETAQIPLIHFTDPQPC